MWVWTCLTVPVFNVSEMGLVCFRGGHCSVQKGCVSPVSFQESNPNQLCWRGSSQAQRYGEALGDKHRSVCFFSHGLKAEKACEWTLADYPLPP